MGIIALDLEILESVIPKMESGLRLITSCGKGRGSRVSCSAVCSMWLE